VCGQGVWRAAAVRTGLQADMADAFLRRDETLSLALPSVYPLSSLSSCGWFIMPHWKQHRVMG